MYSLFNLHVLPSPVEASCVADYLFFNQPVLFCLESCIGYIFNIYSDGVRCIIDEDTNKCEIINVG